MNSSFAATLERSNFTASELCFGSSRIFALNLYLTILRRLPDMAGFRHYEIAARTPTKRPELIRAITLSDEAKRIGVKVTHDIQTIPTATEIESTTKALSLFCESFIPVMLRITFNASIGDDSRLAAFQLIANVNVEQMHIVEAQVAELRGRINRTQNLVDIALQNRSPRLAQNLGPLADPRHFSSQIGGLESKVQQLSDGFDSLHKFVTEDLQRNLVTYIISLVSVTNEKLDHFMTPSVAELAREDVKQVSPARN